jgi:hypothetical protein
MHFYTSVKRTNGLEIVIKKFVLRATHSFYDLARNRDGIFFIHQPHVSNGFSKIRVGFGKATDKLTLMHVGPVDFIESQS